MCVQFELRAPPRLTGRESPDPPRCKLTCFLVSVLFCPHHLILLIPLPFSISPSPSQSRKTALLLFNPLSDPFLVAKSRVDSELGTPLSCGGNSQYLSRIVFAARTIRYILERHSIAIRSVTSLHSSVRQRIPIHFRTRPQPVSLVAVNQCVPPLVRACDQGSRNLNRACVLASVPCASPYRPARLSGGY